MAAQGTTPNPMVEKDVENAGASNLVSDSPNAHSGKALTMREQLWVEVDPHQSSGPLAAYCLMTGYMYAEIPALCCWLAEY